MSPRSGFTLIPVASAIHCEQPTRSGFAIDIVVDLKV